MIDLKDKFIVIQHNDDAVKDFEVLCACDTMQEALDYILNEYYEGDKEQMQFEFQGNNYWDENGKGMQIVY